MASSAPPPPGVLSSPLMSLAGIYDTIEKLIKLAEKQQKKHRLTRLLTRSPRLFLIIDYLGDQVRDLHHTSRDNLNFFENIESERLSKVFESSVSSEVAQITLPEKSDIL